MPKQGSLRGREHTGAALGSVRSRDSEAHLQVNGSLSYILPFPLTKLPWQARCGNDGRMRQWLTLVIPGLGGWPQGDQMCTVVLSYLEHPRPAWATFDPA